MKCAPPLIVASGINEKTLKRDGVCAASLPTTMSIVAGFLVQNCLKYLLGFGEVSDYLGYTAMSDFFPKYTMKPNPQCDNKHCVKAQDEYTKYLASLPKEESAPVQQKQVIHEDNEWEICVVDDAVEETVSAPSANAPPEGATYMFEKSTVPVPQEATVKLDESDDLASLMGQLASLKN